MDPLNIRMHRGRLAIFAAMIDGVFNPATSTSIQVLIVFIEDQIGIFEK